MKAEKLVKLIEFISQFGVKLGDADIERIRENASVCRYHRGEWLLKSRHICEYIFFLNSGMVKTTVSMENLEATTWVTLSGNFITSLESLNTGRPSPIAFQAIASSEVIAIHKDSLTDLYQKIPALTGLALKILSKYYAELEILYIFCLSLPATQRYVKLNQYFPDHFCNVPLKYLASMIHVKPETLSRIKKLQQNGNDFGLSKTG